MDRRSWHDCGRRSHPATAHHSPGTSAALLHPKHLAEKILTSRSALEGERKQVTVLFADVSGFTSMAKKLDPEEVHQLMNRAFALMLNEVHRYEGTINQFLGDGIMALFGAPIAHEDHAHLRMDAQRRRIEFFEALRAMTLHGARRRPLVLVVEDLHWIDKASEETLRYLADSIAAARVLLLVTYRPGYQNPFGERTYFTHLALHPLSEPESLTVAQGMLATSALPAELRDLIIRKAEGNPFFVEEVLKALLEVGALTRQDDRYVLGKPITEIDVPDTIQDVIMARIDRLEEPPKKALQLASVIGREFTVRLLDRLSDPEVRLDQYLQELKMLEFINERHFYPELAYMFKHALTHDVAYNSLLMQRRKGLHRVVAMAVEELYAARLLEFYEMLAYHYERGEVWEKALGYLVKAGQKAQQAYANHEALAYYDRASDVCARLGTTVGPTTLLTLYAGKGAAHFLRSEFMPAIEAYRHMREVAQQVGDRPRGVEALYQLGMSCLWAHDFEQALEHAAQAQAIAAAIDAKDSLAGSIWVSGKVPMVTGNLEKARSSFETSLRLSREAGNPMLEGFSLWDLGLLCNWKGEYAQALRLQEQAIALGQRHNPYEASFCQATHSS